MTTLTLEERKARQREINARYYAKNREKHKAAVAAWRKNNPDKVKAAAAQYHATHKPPPSARAQASLDDQLDEREIDSIDAFIDVRSIRDTIRFELKYGTEYIDQLYDRSIKPITI